ncbi:Tm-1-like ATP-binding domain-containing protein [Sulfitobacter sp. MF3-043]|uniref:Tm-1-like ATP-binding domain-containing protein n=1 Tax=Sulfitobacter sediminivivens TaxID=3252902 RepID=UPI0036DD6ECD
MIFLVGTSDTKAVELGYLRDLIAQGGQDVCVVDVGIRAPGVAVDVSAPEVARHHPDGQAAVLKGDDRGHAVAAMALAFARFCTARTDQIEAMIGIGGGGGTSIITQGMRALPYGVPKVMVSTLASGDVAPYVGTSDIIMMPSVTDLAGLNRLSRQILYNAAQSILGMATHPYSAPELGKPSIGLSMFGVTTPSVTQIIALLEDQFDCVVFHATGTGGRCMEQLLSQSMLDGLIDITTTEIADEIVGGVLSAGATRLDAVISSGKPYVCSVGALDMVNFWAPDTVPPDFKDRLFNRHNANVTLMRTTADECMRIGHWIATKLNKAEGPICLLLPEHGISALDIEGGSFWDPVADAALFSAIEMTLIQTDIRKIKRVPHHINDPAFSAAAADAFQQII